MSSESRSERHVAVVTGGASPIGRAIAARLEPDHTVAALDRVRDLGVEPGDPAGARRAAEAVLDRYGRCDVFVHAEAMTAFGPFDRFHVDVWRQVQTVNVESALPLAQAFAPRLQAGGFGPVIFIMSRTYCRPSCAHILAYIASKEALVGMTRARAVGLGAEAIAVTAVAPAGSVDVPADECADTAAHQSVSLPLTPDDLAAVVAMLAGDAAAGLTGQTVTVDGGLVLR